MDTLNFLNELNLSKSKSPFLVKHPQIVVYMGSPNSLNGTQVRHILILLSLFLFSFTVISCSSSSDDGSSTTSTTTDNDSTNDDNTTTTSDNGSSSDNGSVPTKWGTAIWSKDVWDNKSARNHSQWGKSEWNTNQW